MTRLSLIFGKLFDGLALLAAFILLAMVMLVTADIVLRNLTRTGFAFANEVSEYALYGVTLLAAPWLLRRNQHVRIDLLLNAVPVRIASWMDAASNILGVVICLVMVRYGTQMVIDSYRAGSLTIKNLVFSEWWLLWPLPAIFALLALEFMFRLHRSRTAMAAPRAEPTSPG